MIFADTNVLIDVATDDPAWADWSWEALCAAHARGPVLINVVVYAEFAISFASAKACDAELAPFDMKIADPSKDKQPRTILGIEQKEWFKDSLSKSTATWKI